MIVSRHSSVFSAASLETLPSARRLTFKSSIAYIKSRKYLYVSVFTGNLLLLSFGMSFAWSSPVLLRLTQEEYLNYNPIGRVITSEEASWIGSFLAFGGMFGSFMAGYAATKLGRKSSMLLTCAMPFVVAYLLIAFSKTVYLFYIARVLSGFAISGIYTVVPMYLGEIAEDEIRGFICCLIMTFETFGELITYSVCPYVSIFWFSMVFVSVTSLVVLFVVAFLPESPYYYLSKNNRGDAEKSLMRLRSAPKERVRSELDFMQEIMEEAGEEQNKFSELLKTKASRRAEKITLALTVLQHLSGIVPIVFYSQNIFKESGSSLSPDVCTLIIAVVQCISSFVAPNLADRLGRRWTLFISATGMCLAEVFLGLYFFGKSNGYDVTPFFWLPVFCLVFYLISYIGGYGPLLWTIMGEVFPPHLKPPAFTVGVWFWWTMAFTTSKLFHMVAHTIGMAGIFCFFAVVCFLAAVYALVGVVETKGKSFQEIQEMLNK